jgi:hypothetical protein
MVISVHEGARSSLKKMHGESVDNIAFAGSMSSFGLVLKEMGFKWERSQDNRTVLTERFQMTFIRRTAQNRQENRPSVYTHTHTHTNWTLFLV